MAFSFCACDTYYNVSVTEEDGVLRAQVVERGDRRERLSEVRREAVIRNSLELFQQYLELTQAQEPPPAQDGVLPLSGFTDRSCLEVRDAKGDPAPYRLYRLDGALWLSHETGGEADWVFILSEQPESPPPTDEAE